MATGAPKYVMVDKPFFTVWTTWNKGETFFVHYRGFNEEKAIELTNFWDERVDTHLTKFVPKMDYASVLERKTAALLADIQTW